MLNMQHQTAEKEWYSGMVLQADGSARGKVLINIKYHIVMEFYTRTQKVALRPNKLKVNIRFGIWNTKKSLYRLGSLTVPARQLVKYKLD
jgi:hypothetical protein